MRTIMGDYLKCFHCIVCGARFIVNKGPRYKSISNYYQCPSCHTYYGVEPADSFLKAMVSEERVESTVLVEETLKANGALEPLKAFLNVPCEMCEKPITEWTEQNVNLAINGVGWGHSQCWNSHLGQLKQWVKLAKEIQGKSQ